MTVIEKERTARKPHRCSECNGRIRPGERYKDWRVPPDGEVNSSGTWWRGAAHIDSVLCCRETFYQDTPEDPEGEDRS